MTRAAAAFRVAALVLAAGGSRRMGRAGPKQLLAWRGEALVRRAARAALDSRCDAAYVVIGAHADAVRAALDGLAVQTVACADWEEGIAASIRAGVREAARAVPPFDAALLALADQPGVGAAHLDALVARAAAGATLVASAYAGTFGAPAVFARSWFGALLELRGDRGARAVLEEHAASVVQVPCEAAAFDVDDPADVGPA